MDGYIFLPFPLLRVSIYQASDYNNKAGAKRCIQFVECEFRVALCRRETFRDLSIKKGRFYVSIFESRLNSDSKMSFCILPLEFLWKIFGRISRIVL